MKKFCIIPAWNEEKNIAAVIDGLRPFVDEIIVVDDCSVDNTSKVAKERNATVLRHIINRRQGAALRTGTEYALTRGAELIVHFDADGQFLPEDLPEAIKAITEEGFDIVFGSRFMGRESNMPWLKKNIFFPVARLVNFLFFGIKTTDPQSGFRVMSADAARKIEIKQRGSAHCSEILAKAHSLRLKIKEVPITVVYKRFGQNFSGGWHIVKDLILAKMMD